MAKPYPFPLDEKDVLSKDMWVTVVLFAFMLALTGGAGAAGYYAVQSLMHGKLLAGLGLAAVALVVGLPSGFLAILAFLDPFSGKAKAYRAFTSGRIADGLTCLVELNEFEALYKYLDSMLVLPDETSRPLIRAAAEQLFGLRELLAGDNTGLSEEFQQKLKSDTETALTGLWGTCERQRRVADQNLDPSVIADELTAENEKLRQLGERIGDVRTQIARLTLTSGDGAIDRETVRQFEAFAEVTRQMNRFNATSQ